MASTARADGLVLRGKIRNPIADTIYITYNNNRLAYDPVEQKLLLNRDGSFSTALTVTEKFTIVSLKYAGRKADLVVEPGYDLELGAEGKNFDTSLHYKGDGSGVANFVAQHTIEKGLMENYITKLQPRFIDTIPEFKKVMAEAEQDEVLFLNKHMSEVSTDFIRYWVSYYHFLSYFGLMQYPLYHEMALQKTYYVKNISPSNYGILSAVPEIFNDSLLGIPTYRLYIDMLFKLKLGASGFNNVPKGDERSKYQQTDSAINLAYKRMPPATAEYAIASAIYANARQQPVERTEKLLDKYKKQWPNSTYITDISRQIAIVKRLAKGQKAMDFAINTPQGANTKLSELKGKVVLLTFWSNAYEQGLIDLRLTSKLYHKFKDSGVAFVYVSIDESDVAWRGAIEKNKLSGIHTRTNGWKSMLATLYGIQGVPTFFLVDKKGNFASDNVPLPRQGEALSYEISRLLKE